MARSKSNSTACSRPAASPTIVNTDRLCDASDEWSSSRTPATPLIASTIAAMTWGRRPSLTLGMHSMIMSSSRFYRAALCFCHGRCYNRPAIPSSSMPDPLRTVGTRALDADRDAKIEQILLAGLDRYFAAQYEQAINVWTRVLFLDRNHARARAYIERARSALAERQRESEELLQGGLAAFGRGDGDDARRLLQAAA